MSLRSAWTKILKKSGGRPFTRVLLKPRIVRGFLGNRFSKSGAYTKYVSIFEVLVTLKSPTGRRLLKNSISILGVLLTSCQQQYPLEPQKFPSSTAPLPTLSSDGGGVSQEKEWKIGLLLPLSGERQSWGEGLLNAAQLAFLKTPSDRQVLIPMDSKGTAEGAIRGAEQLLSQGVRIIIGPLTAIETAAIKPMVTARHVPVLSFSNDRNVAGNGVFILGVLPDDQVQRVLDYANSYGIVGMALLAPRTIFGEDVARLLEEGQKQRKAIEPVHAAFYPATGVDPSSVITPSIESLKWDVIVYPESGQNMQSLAAYMGDLYRKTGMRRNCIGFEGWRSSPTLLNDPNLKGCHVVGLSVERLDKFAPLFKEHFGTEPHSIAGLAYDAVQLVKKVLAHPAANLTTALTQPTGFLGIYGPFRLLQNGLNQRKLALYTVTGEGALRLDEPAKSAF